MLRINTIFQTNYGTFRGWVRTALAEAEFRAGRLNSFLAPDPLKVHRLVFVCLGNINRSPFASAVAQTMGAVSCSIGLSTTTGAPANQTAVQLAPRFNANLSEHTATNIEDYCFQAGDLLLAMEVRHAKQLLAMGVPAASITFLGHWSKPHRIHLHDPHTLSNAYYEMCFSHIRSAVSNLIAYLRANASPSVLR